MIRFVDMSAAIGEPCLAFFDTVTDRFVEFGGDQVWSSRAEFEGAFVEANPHGFERHELERYLRLIPAAFA